MDKPANKQGKRIIKFAPSFRQSCKNMGLSEEETRHLELDVIKSQAKLREGIEEADKWLRNTGGS